MPQKGKTPSKSPRSGLSRVISHLRQLDRDTLSQVAEKLSDERTTLQAVVHSLQEAVILVDHWGVIELLNQPAQRILGLEEKTELPNLWRAAPELAKLLKVGRNGSLTLMGPLTHQLEIHYPSPRLARLFATPLAEGQQILIVLSDETQQREATERQVEEARLNSLTQLAAGVAHELGNPLNAIQIHLQVLERALKKEKLSKEKNILSSLATAQNEVTRLDEIIRNFLQAIRPTPAHLQPTDLIAVLEEVLSTLHGELVGAGIRVEVSLPGLLPTVMADAQQVKQVYFNVIKNAREACPSGGTLLIRASTDDEFFHLHFTDSGAGISEENLAHLFEPYHTTKPQGTGLGLMIAQKIMRAHQGSIRVESRLKEGTTVTLSWPLQNKRFKTLAAGQSTPPALPRPTPPRS